ncbi:MAG: hypothetical protein HY906_00185 [Deltaproteobacteria bacterium]|nr:hypothetical protein [Deltaproteobacteria bacterium]
MADRYISNDETQEYGPAFRQRAERYRELNPIVGTLIDGQQRVDQAMAEANGEARALQGQRSVAAQAKQPVYYEAIDVMNGFHDFLASLRGHKFAMSEFFPDARNPAESLALPRATGASSRRTVRCTDEVGGLRQCDVALRPAAPPGRGRRARWTDEVDGFRQCNVALRCAAPPRRGRKARLADEVPAVRQCTPGPRWCGSRAGRGDAAARVVAYWRGKGAGRALAETDSARGGVRGGRGGRARGLGGRGQAALPEGPQA